MPRWVTIGIAAFGLSYLLIFHSHVVQAANTKSPSARPGDTLLQKFVPKGLHLKDLSSEQIAQAAAQAISKSPDRICKVVEATIETKSFPIEEIIGAVVGAVAKVDPSHVCQVVGCAVQIRPKEVDKIVKAAVSAVPDQVPCIITKAIESAPGSVNIIVAAAINAAPDQATRIAAAAIHAAPAAAGRIRNIIMPRIPMSRAGLNTIAKLPLERDEAVSPYTP